MKSEINVAPPSVITTFPMLMKDSRDGEVILFHRAKFGITVAVGDNSQVYVGKYREDIYMADFAPITGSVTLSK